METFKYEDYLTGARNCCRYIGLERGHQFLLLSTDEFLESEPMTVQALKQAGEEMGAEVSVALIEALGTRGNPPRQLQRAIEASDAFIGMGDKKPNPITGHARTALKARWDYGSKQIDIRGGRGILATECSKFPNEILLAIVHSMHAGLRNARSLKIVDAKGTQLDLPYDPRAIYFGGTYGVDHLEPGQRTTWPLGHFMLHPQDAFSGVAMIDCIRGTKHVMEKPARVDIRDCRIAMEERPETAHSARELAKPGNSSFVNTVFIGFNPKGSVVKGVARPDFGELRPAAGVINIGIGDRAGHVASNFNTSVIVLEADIVVDGKLFSERGRLAALDDPEVRKVASKFGDPDQLLSQALYDI